MSKRFNVILQDQHDNSKIYVTAGLNFGFASQYSRYGEQLIKINPAAILFLAKQKEIYAKSILQKKIEIAVSAGATILTFLSMTGTVDNDMRCFYQTVTYLPHESEFLSLRDSFKKKYAQNFSQQIRLELMSIEFLHHHKRFNTDEFHKGMEKLTYEEIKIAQKYVFDRSAINIFIDGKIERTEENMTSYFPEYEEEQLSLPLVLPLGSNEIIGKKLLVKQLDKPRLLVHTNATAMPVEDIYVAYQLLTEHYRASGNAVVSVDVFEMGLTLENVVAQELLGLDACDFSTYRDNLVAQVAYLHQKKRKLYAEWFVKLWLAGISYPTYFLNLQEWSVEELQEKVKMVLQRSLVCQVMDKGEQHESNLN